MVTALAVLGVLAVLAAAAAVALWPERTSGLVEAPPDAPDLQLPHGPLRPEHVERLRFPMALRGYRMRDVDVVLERVGRELAERDRRIAELEAGAGEPAEQHRPTA